MEASPNKPKVPKSNWEAAQLAIFLGLAAAVVLWALSAAAFLIVLFLEFLLPIPVYLRARTKAFLFAMIPNTIVNSVLLFVHYPPSPHSVDWRKERPG